jgi:hypothetical protein
MADMSSAIVSADVIVIECFYLEKLISIPHSAKTDPQFEPWMTRFELRRARPASRPIPPSIIETLITIAASATLLRRWA